MAPALSLGQEFGSIDIYLFDQLLKGRIAPGMRVLDAGCGSGRNLIYLLRQKYDIFGVDAEPVSIAEVRALAAVLNPDLAADHFRIENIERMSFPSSYFNAIISNAVLHFVRDDAQFIAVMREMWRVLRPGGVFFCRLASIIGTGTETGMEHQRLDGRRYLSPDGAERFAVDQAFLLDVTAMLGGQLLDPLKTTLVQDQRCMTTWVVRKND
jgi:SAM-dependent methyltransferase